VASTEPRWEGLYESLKDQIESGDLPPGAQLPTERDLMDESGLARGTVRRALLELEQAGLVRAARGRAGRTVRERTRISFDMSKFELGAYTDDPARGMDQWYSGVRDAGWTPRQVVDSAIGIPAPAHVAEFLGLGTGDLVIRRRRLRYVSKPEDGIGEQLAMIADTWTPVDIAQMKVDGVAPLLSNTDVTLPGGIYHALGFRQVRFVDSIEARMPTDEETALMRLPPGTAVGQHARVGIDVTGRRVRVLIQTWAGDRQVIVYDLPVPERRLPDTDQIPGA
jgi:GntR family transcriptional regulator